MVNDRLDTNGRGDMGFASTWTANEHDVLRFIDELTTM